MARNSIYRGGNSQAEQNDSAGKNQRHSLLQNAQLEITRVNRNSNKASEVF